MPGYYFNLPPITALTRAQQAALNETEQIALSGGPGTGKSVVSIWRHISNYRQGNCSLLLTYTTTLKRYLEACCRGNNAAAAQFVGTSSRNRSIAQNRKFFEVIIDEAQDLDPGYFAAICSPVSYGADDSQILYPTRSTTQAQLAAIFPDNVPYVLDKNFRCTQEIMQFAKQAFPRAAISSNMINNIDRHGDMPSLLIGNWGPIDMTPNTEILAILQIIKDLRNDTENIAILLPWKSSVQKYVSALKNNNVDDFSFYYADSIDFPNGCPPLKNVHITTFKSAKGLEFDTVIIPDFNKMAAIVGNYNVDWQDFYVGCTRARSNLFLLSNIILPPLNGVVNISFLPPLN